MKQVLGHKKLLKCRGIGGIEYAVAFTRGGWGHGWAQCWYERDSTGWLTRADMVNYKTGEVKRDIYEGK